MPDPPPLLLMSGYALSMLELEVPLLIKPFHPSDLLAAVERLLGPGSHPAEGPDAD